MPDIAGTTRQCPPDESDAERVEDGSAPAHDHNWAILAVQPHTPFTLLGPPVPHTIVLMRCTECGEPDSRMLPGEWTLKVLRETREWNEAERNADPS